MKVTKRSKVNEHASSTVSAEPRQDSTLRSSHWDVSDTAKEMTVTYQDIEPTTSGHLHFERIVEASSEEPRLDFDSSFTKSLFNCCVKESIKVRLSVGNPQVSVVARHSINSQPTDVRQWYDKVVKEHECAFVDLFKAEKFEFVSLLRVNSFAVHNVAEKQDVDIVGLVGLDEGMKFGRYCCQRSACSLDIPSSSSSPEVKIRDEE